MGLVSLLMEKDRMDKKSVQNLRNAGKLEEAEADVASPKYQVPTKNAVFGENYLLLKDGGALYAYSDLMWAYAYRETVSFFTQNSVQFTTYSGLKGGIATRSYKQSLAVLQFLSRTAKKCAFGYTPENKQKYNV